MEVNKIRIKQIVYRINNIIYKTEDINNNKKIKKK